MDSFEGGRENTFGLAVCSTAKFIFQIISQCEKEMGFRRELSDNLYYGDDATKEGLYSPGGESTYIRVSESSD